MISARVVVLTGLIATTGLGEEKPPIPSFAKFLTNATSVEILPARERSVTFSHARVLRPANGQDSEVSGVYADFLQAKDQGKKLTQSEVTELMELSQKPYDASGDPIAGWSDSFVIRGDSERGEDQYWICRIMRAGFLFFCPAEELYEPQANGRSCLFQEVRSEGARTVSFSAISSEWRDTLEKIRKPLDSQNNTEQREAHKP